ncbi:hypothetical protein GY45DRAFT_1263856 [Cubamyces sp. BRFM 1775]|nr:hypothetical protein GY45DRAFT_1263856 [Cubamyces sp. BRFM 1775]
MRQDLGPPNATQNREFNATVALSGGRRHFTVIHGLEVPTDDITSPTFDETKHHQYRFWRGKDWAPYAQGGIHAQEAAFDGVPIYLEDEDGRVFTPPQYAELRKLITTLLQTLAMHKLAPESWGKRTIHASRYVQYETYKRFPSLAQCEAHFRLNTLLTRMYPDFHKSHQAKVVKRERDDDDIATETAVRAPKRAKEKREVLFMSSSYSVS